MKKIIPIFYLSLLILCSCKSLEEKWPVIGWEEDLPSVIVTNIITNAPVIFPDIPPPSNPF